MLARVRQLGPTVFTSKRKHTHNAHFYIHTHKHTQVYMNTQACEHINKHMYMQTHKLKHMSTHN